MSKSYLISSLKNATVEIYDQIGKEFKINRIFIPLAWSRSIINLVLITLQHSIKNKF